MSALIAYKVPDVPAMQLVPARRFPGWTKGVRNARPCLPMQAAASHGWLLLNPTKVVVRWDGGPGRKALTVDADRFVNPVASLVGTGIVSWQMPYLLRTPHGWATRVSGPINACKPDVAPLEGIVETSWYAGLAAMNWKVTRPGVEIAFEAGEPVAQLQTVRLAEAAPPVVRDLASDAGLLDEYLDWRHARQEGDRTSYTRRALAAARGRAP